MTVQVSIFNESKQPQDMDDGFGEVSYLPEFVENVAPQIDREDPLEACLRNLVVIFILMPTLKKLMLC